MTSRVDMHCHSSASQLSKLGVQRSLGLPECATPPQEVYELAKRRGMDFVTITDHDTIDGCLELADRPDCFVSEELTTRFAGEPQAVHILCYGVTVESHEWLQAHAGDVEACAGYLHENEIACALAHPFFDVAAPLTPRHRHCLAELFPIWEVRNGSRAGELNMPAVLHVETNGGTGIGGSDDHAGVDIGRTFTEVPVADTPEEFLLRLREGAAAPGGDQGSPAKLAHAAIALATRALALDARGAHADEPLDPLRVWRIASRLLAEGAARGGKVAPDIGPADARALLDAWLASIGFDLRGQELLDYLQSDEFSHAKLYRRVRRVHEDRLRAATGSAIAAIGQADASVAMRALFEALVPAIPYVPPTAFVAAEKARLSVAPLRPRVALVADGIGGVHGVATAIEQIRKRGVRGFEIEVIGTDANVDRRLPATSELAIPFYEELKVGVPALSDLAESLAEGRYDLIHVTAPGPTGVAATLLGRMSGTPLVASYHTELVAYAHLRSGDERLAAMTRSALGAFYGAPAVVLSPSPAADHSLLGLGVPPERIERWERGVDLARFAPGRRSARAFPGELKVLYAGRLTREKGIDLLAESFLRARRRDQRLHLILAGGGPEENELRERLGEHATFLGWLEGDELARTYASADVFLFCSQTETYGQVVIEAGASGLPVVAVAEGGPAALIEHRRTGLLCEPDPEHVVGAILQLAGSPRLRRRLGDVAAQAARGRTWERALGQLAAGYRKALVGTEEAAVPSESRALAEVEVA